ncbi:MAG: hypothetical protein ABI811_17655 [Acidobacteriota bacterium]
MRKPILLALNAVAVALVATALLAQLPEPIFGTWKVNLTKSKYSPGPAPKSNTKRYEAYKGGLKATQDAVTAKGDIQHVEIVGAFDGKDYPATGNPEADTYAFKHAGDRTYEITQKKAGQVTITSKTVISADGKTRTVEQTGKNTKGEAVKNAVLWERQ